MRRWIAVFLVVLMVCPCPLASLATADAGPGPSATVTGFSNLVRMVGREPTDPGFRLSSLQVDIWIEPTQRLMRADYSADLELSSGALSDVQNWAFWPAEWVAAVTLGGVPVPLSQGVQAPEMGEYHTISLALGELGDVVDRGSSARLVIATTGEIPEALEVERYGIVQDMQQTVNELCALCDSRSNWTLTVTVPAGWSVLSKGDWADSAPQEDGETTSFSWIVPVSKMGANFMVVAGPYTRVDLDLPGDIGLWFLREDTAGREQLVAAVSDVLKRANRVMFEDIGIPPVEKLEIVKASIPGHSVSGKGPHGMVLVEYGRGNPFNQDLFLQTISHELMHQWFPGKAELDFTTGLWLSEGMATYFDSRCLRCEWPPEQYFANQKGYKPQPFSMDQLSSSFASMPWVAKMNVLYLRGAWIVNALRATIGDDAFSRTISRFYLGAATELRGTPEFQAVAEEESGTDLAAFFDAWLGTASTPKISLENATLSRAPDGWRVEGDVVNRSPMPVPPVTVSIVSGGSPVAATEVVLPFVAGMDLQQASFEIHTPSLLADVVLDPDHDILNLAESGRQISLALTWARQPWVIAAVGVALASLLFLVLLEIKRCLRWVRSRRQSQDQQPVDGVTGPR